MRVRRWEETNLMVRVETSWSLFLHFFHKVVFVQFFWSRLIILVILSRLRSLSPSAATQSSGRFQTVSSRHRRCCGFVSAFLESEITVVHVKVVKRAAVSDVLFFYGVIGRQCCWCCHWFIKMKLWRIILDCWNGNKGIKNLYSFEKTFSFPNLNR